MTSERDRWYVRLERLQNRTDKIWEELVRSSLGPEEKAELWDSFWSFMNGMCVSFERRYPELKK